MIQRNQKSKIRVPDGKGAHTLYNRSTMSEERNWYFTWGYGQKHENGYAVIHGTFNSAREEMIRRHGQRWAFQYPNSETAGVHTHSLHQIK